MAEKHTVAMFKDVNGEKVQIGWATPIDPSTGGRQLERSPGFEKEPMSGVFFDDDVVHEEPEADEVKDESDEDENYPQAGDEGKDSQPLQVENNETVELNAGGSITEIEDESDEDADDSSDEDEEAEFERELAEEQAAEQAKTRRELRENQENN